MKKIILSIALLVTISTAFTQNVGIGTTVPNPSAALEIKADSKGLLIPRVALTGNTDVTTVPSAATSLLVYNTATAGAAATAVTPGFYYWNSNNWLRLSPGSSGSSGGWSLNGNSGTNATNFIGTTDITPVRFRINNSPAGYMDLGGGTFFGLAAGMNNSGLSNAGFGGNALANNSTGKSNTAFGNTALPNNTTGNNNTAVGFHSSFFNTLGFSTRTIIIQGGITYCY
jgi:hypothetical protein